MSAPGLAILRAYALGVWVFSVVLAVRRAEAAVSLIAISAAIVIAATVFAKPAASADGDKGDA